MNLTTTGGAPVRRVAFGAEQLGGYEWGPVDAGEIGRAVAEACVLGGIFFDTADCYGRGESERRLGTVLKPFRRNVFLSTKFGVRFDEGGKVFYDNTPDYAERALDASLRRLEVAQVDMLQVHWPDGRTPPEQVFERLERLREDGRIRCYGVSNFSLATLEALPGEWPGFAAFSGQFNLLECGEHARIARLCERRGLAFLSFGSLAQGLLSGKYRAPGCFAIGDRRSREGYSNFHGTRFERNLAIVDRLTAIAAETRRYSAAQLAIRFVLDALPRAIAVVGVKSREQLRDNLKALEGEPGPQVLRALWAAAEAG